MKAKSILNLNGDKSLKWFEKLIYLFVNCCRNIIGDVSRLQHIRKFKPRAILQREDDVPYSVSPSRRVSDYFWMSVDYNALIQSLNSRVRVLDIGCGSGRYYSLLGHELDRAMASYKGLDLSRRIEWDDIDAGNDNVCFVVDDARNSFSHLTDENLIISQSALEHIEHDKETVIRLCAVLSKKKYPSIQIHLVPASHTLFSYLLHGFRQYSKGRLKTIVCDLEKQEDVRCEVFALGGWRCLFTHLKWFTIARKKSILDYSSEQREKYGVECKEAVKQDCQSDSLYSPDFFALVVHVGTAYDIRVR